MKLDVFHCDLIDSFPIDCDRNIIWFVYGNANFWFYSVKSDKCVCLFHFPYVLRLKSIINNLINNMYQILGKICR